MYAVSVKELADLTKGEIIYGDETKKVTKCSTSSKEGDSNTIFIPIIGERVNGHNYIKDAYKHGVRVTFTSERKIVEDTKEMTYIAVEHTLHAFQEVAAFYRDKFNFPIIGITGSVGKTTTKEMVAVALEGCKHVLKTEGNLNSQIGVAQMMMRLNGEQEVAVIEMGMSLPGEMKRLAKIVKPSTAIITNIGVSHIGQLKSQENICREKLTMIDDMLEGGILLLNGTDPLLKKVYFEWRKKDGFFLSFLPKKTREKLLACKVKTYGKEEFCDYQAIDIQTITEEGMKFTAVIKTEDRKEKKEEIQLSVLGEHNVLNALVALAVADIYKIPIESAKEGLARYQPIAMRGGIEEIGEITLIDDTYNASPDSMKSGIDVLCSIKNAKRRVVILADILELGEFSEQCHREVGFYLAQKPVELIITVGEMANYIALEAAEKIKTQQKNFKREIENFKDKETLCSKLTSFLENGDAILIKGSRGMHLEVVVNQIKEWIKQ